MHIMSHLAPTSISTLSMVSRRFYNLVTTPHAWRAAFSRFFPGQAAISDILQSVGAQDVNQVQLEQRSFARLTSSASWRSEYIYRTRLLRSLARGKPSFISSGHGASTSPTSAANNANAVVTYSSYLSSVVNHIAATWDNGRKSPRFIHGTDETGAACTSDPNIGKIDNWGHADVQSLPQFSDVFFGELPSGMGDGPTGLPNVMDVSQPFGMIYGAGFPGGRAYYRATDEQRGRFLVTSIERSDHTLGIPSLPTADEAYSAVWIAHTNAMPIMSGGFIGLMTASTLGVVTSFALGVDSSRGARLGRGQMTARWVICPGVPIIALCVDEQYNEQRKENERIWAVALNALGEVYYMIDSPDFTTVSSNVAGQEPALNAWKVGRTAQWKLVEQSRRVAREDPYGEFTIQGSYSPRSSTVSMKLSKEQVVAETREVESFLKFRPSYFRKVCDGWDMQRKLEVDFAGDDGRNAGESIFSVLCGQNDSEPSIRRFTRCKVPEASLNDYPMPRTPPTSSPKSNMASLFGGGAVATDSEQLHSNQFETKQNDQMPNVMHLPQGKVREEWHTSILTLAEYPDMEITALCTDLSNFATTTVNEDSLDASTVTIKGTKALSSPSPTTPIPGLRARFLAVGTNSGLVVVFDMRGPQSRNPALTNELRPLRIIVTESPQISCLAMSALYLVHGGNDGLVQAWDVLASTTQPVRTLNSRFSSRARRRLVQAEASIQGVGTNLYAAGAIVIDPDPSVLRGMVSLGTHLRYWSYSSSTTNQRRSKKRRSRRSTHHSSNGGPERHTSGGKLKDYIATEQEELRQEKLRRAKHDAFLQGRFGVGIGGLNEQEMLRYAQMVSAESYQQESERRASDIGYSADTSPASTHSAWSSDSTITRNANSHAASLQPQFDTGIFEQDLEEAIRLSLLDGTNEHGQSPTATTSRFEVPITYKAKKNKGTRSNCSSPSSQTDSMAAADDLDLALKLSLAYQEH